MGSSFAPDHIGMPLVSAKLKLDLLRRQVLMSRNISGGSLISVFMGRLNYQIEHHVFPRWRDPICVKRSRLSPPTAPPKVPLYPHHALAVLPRRNWLPQHRRTTRKDPFLCPMVAQRRASSPEPHTPQVEAEWRRQAQLGPAEHGLRPEHRCPGADRAAGPPLPCGERLTGPGQGSPLFTPGERVRQRPAWTLPALGRRLAVLH